MRLMHHQEHQTGRHGYVVYMYIGAVRDTLWVTPTLCCHINSCMHAWPSEILNKAVRTGNNTAQIAISCKGGQPKVKLEHAWPQPVT